jgi:hypothetical protein
MNYFTNKQIFYINSNNRLDGTHSNFTYSINIDQNSEYDRVVVLASSIPKSYYLVDSQYNSFTLKEGVDDVLIIFEAGNYTRNSMSIQLSTVLNTNSPNNYTYAVSYSNINLNPDNGKYVITVSNNGGVQPELIFGEQLNEQLGFNKNQTYQFVGDVLRSANVINLTNETTLFIRSDICQNKEGNNILQEIYTAGEPNYSMTTFLNPTPHEYSKKITTTKSNIYTFYLTDENGLMIDTNGININITLMIYKENDIDRMLKGAIKYFTLISDNKK